MPDLALPPPQVISVSELNRIAREALERNLPLLWVAGEISNFKRYDSGHCYFTLKDAQRSEERRVGKECSVTCRSRWSPYH